MFFGVFFFRNRVRFDRAVYICVLCFAGRIIMDEKTKWIHDSTIWAGLVSGVYTCLVIFDGYFIIIKHTVNSKSRLFLKLR